MAITNKQLEYWILKSLEDCSQFKGAGCLAYELSDKGLRISEAGVGRTLRALRNVGLLEKEGKRGHRITLLGLGKLARLDEERELRAFLNHTLDDPHKLGRVNLIDRLIVRKALEREAAYRAALNADDGDIAMIDEIVRAQYENMRNNEDPADMSAQFHRAVLRASKVPLLETLYDFIGITSKWQNFFVGTFKMYDTPLNISHEKVLEALKARDPDGAAMAMESHLEDVIINAGKLSLLEKE